MLLARCQAEILAACETEKHDRDQQRQPIHSLVEWRPKEPAHVEKVRLARRAGRYARYQQVIELHEQGRKPKEIAHQLGLSDRTVHRWLASGTFPEAKKRRKRHSSFDTFAPYVLKLWQEGEHIGIHIFREMREQGYTGSERSVYRYLETLKQAEVKAPVNPARIQKYSVNTAVWLFVRDPERREEVEREDLAAFCQASPPPHQSLLLHSRILDHGPPARRRALRCLVGKNHGERSSRTPVLCLGSRTRQSCCESRFNLVDQ